MIIFTTVKNLIPALTLSVLLASCSQNGNQENTSNPYAPVKVEARPEVIPADKVGEPEVIEVEEAETTEAGEPAMVEANTNVVFAGEPQFYRVPENVPVKIPGVDSVLMPEVEKARDSSALAAVPEMVQAKDAADKDQNPANFSYYQVKEGLKSNNIRSLLQDSKGNLWFGTYGSGVTRYDGKFFTHFTMREGLANNYVWCIIEDHQGNIWFGTSKGVCKYDGRKFTYYTENGGLTNNEVMAIYQDKKGNLWFGTDGGGVSVFDGKNYTHYTEKNGLISNYINSIKGDSRGNIWFATYGGICKFDGKQFTHFTEEQVLNNDYVMSILEDKQGNMWFSSNGGGICKYDGERFEHYSSNTGLSDDYVISMAMDKEGHLWLGTYGSGVNKFDGKFFTHYNEKQGLSNSEVWGIMADKTGNIWFATNGGVNKYDGGSFKHFTTAEGLGNNVVLSVKEDHRGNLWFGTNGGGVTTYDGLNFKQYTEDQGLSDNYVWCVLEDRDYHLWFGTNGGVTEFDGKNFTVYKERDGLSGNEVWSAMQDSKGNIWFGTNGGVCKFDGKRFTQYAPGLGFNYVLSIIEDKKGNIWFGTDGFGLTCYDGKTFKHYTEKGGLANDDIWSLMEDHAGNIWIATEGGGACKFDGKYFTHYTEKQGLTDNVVISMLEDKQGNLWLGTQNGLNKLNPRNAARLQKIDNESKVSEQVYFTHYTYPEGFLGINVRSNMVQDKTGYIWVGSGDRLTRYDPNSDFTDTEAPNMQITAVKMFNESVDWEKLRESGNMVLSNGVNLHDASFSNIAKWYNVPTDLNVPYNNNYLNISFIGISQRSPRQVRYQYKLEGVDEKWSLVSPATEAPYGNLSPGNYVFKVRAMNGEGVWSKPVAYAFEVRPPWWKTLWFRIVAAVSVIIGLYLLYRWRTASLINRQKQLERTVNERTAEVRAQKELVEERNKEITDSINYARRIQYALLAHDELLKKQLPQHFVLFKPKDIVSGDFYWGTVKQTESSDLFYLAVCDSTGHGVPGAFMSLLNISFLNEAVTEKDIHQPNKVLDHVRQRLIENISQEGAKDGMDGILACFDWTQNTITYAAAHNPPVIIRGREVMELGHDKMPIGYSDKFKEFSLHTIEVQKGDTIFFMTDGFADQFGGEKGKKYKNKQLYDFLARYASSDFGSLKDKLAVEFDQWKGDLEQVDDVLIVGIKIG